MESWASAAGGKGGVVPWIFIFIHGTNIVDKGLKVLIFGVFFFYLLFFFSFPPPPLERT